MGLILDSSVVIAAERRGDTVERLIERVVSMAGDQDAALSAVGLTELVHGRSTSALCLLEDARSVAGMQSVEYARGYTCQFAYFRTRWRESAFARPGHSKAVRQAELAIRRLAAMSGSGESARNLESSAPNVRTSTSFPLPTT